MEEKQTPCRVAYLHLLYCSIHPRDSKYNAQHCLRFAVRRVMYQGSIRLLARLREKEASILGSTQPRVFTVTANLSRHLRSEDAAHLPLLAPSTTHKH